MYTSFLGLKKKPFELTVDPFYLYVSPSHREVLANLVYGIQEKKGIIVVTGEVGTGKTTLLHTLLENLGTQVKTAFVSYPKMCFEDILHYVLEDFGIQVPRATTAQRLMRLKQFLIDQHNKGETTVLILDEAQNLPFTLLEDIRMLSNLEIVGAKLLQIVLVGQPELQRKLHEPRLRQLRQRIGASCETHPLSDAETRDYVWHRFTAAGGDAQAVFPQRTLKAIHAYTGGLPRLINAVCDKALLVGYVEEQRQISPRIVRQVARDLDLRPHRGILTAHPWKAAAVLTGLLLLSAVSAPVSFAPLQNSLQHGYQFLKVRLEGSNTAAAPPSHGLELAIAAAGPAAGDTEDTTSSSQNGRGSMADQGNRPISCSGCAKRQAFSPPILEDRLSLLEGPVAHETEPPRTNIALQAPSTETVTPPKRSLPLTKTVRQGDYVVKLAIETYRFSTQELITWLKENNPHIEDINRIRVGDVLLFPPLDVTLE
jgi:general secretion pathway protein A